MAFHKRKLDNPQLQRALKLLLWGGKFSTREIALAARSFAPATVISEVRAHVAKEGWQINCTREGSRYYYRLEVQPCQ